MKLTQTIANVLSSLIATWAGLYTLGLIPDKEWSRLISAVCVGLQIFMMNMGFNRTPGGTMLPESVKQLVDGKLPVGSGITRVEGSFNKLDTTQ